MSSTDLKYAAIVIGGTAVLALLLAFAPTYGPDLHAALDPVLEIGRQIFVVVGVICFLLGLYFMPAIIALSSQRRQWIAIAAVNLLLGWTVLGWIVALVWSLIVDRPDARAS